MMRLIALNLLFLLSSSLLASAAPVEVPSASFPPGVDLAAWTLAPGVALDATAGAQAPGCLHFALAPKLNSASATVKLPQPLPSWTWHRLSFAYRLAPGTVAAVSWTETDAQGVVHRRSAAGRLRLAPAADWTSVSCDFLSWPDAQATSFTFEARLLNDQIPAGGLFLDDLALEARAPAPVAPAREIARAVPNHGFESPNLPGYYNLMNGATATVAEGDAPEGRHYLQVRGTAHLYPPTRHDLVFECGHLYRLSLRARGAGTLALGLHIGYLIFDTPTGSAQPVTLSPDWRPVQADFLLDATELRDIPLVMLIGGSVDVDDLQVVQLR